MYTLIGFKFIERVKDGVKQTSYNFYLGSPIEEHGEGQQTFEVWQPSSKVNFIPVAGMALNAVFVKRSDGFAIDHLEEVN